MTSTRSENISMSVAEIAKNLNDAGIPPAHVNRIEEALKGAGKDVEFQIYKGAGHGFFCDDRGSYNKEASENAWPRTLTFFGKLHHDLVLNSLEELVKEFFPDDR